MEKAVRVSIFVLVGVLTFSANRAAITVGSSQTFPSGKWSFSAHPYMGEGYESRPVVVTSVKTELKTLAVTAVRVRNISSKPVIGIRFGWYLSKDAKRNTILKHGETPANLLDRKLATGEGRTMLLPVVSFREIYKPLLRNNQLEGDYRIEVAVIDVVFDDQSRWTPKQKVSATKALGASAIIVEVALGKSFKPLTVTPLEAAPPCPRQNCVLVEGPPDFYTCSASQNEEYCTNCFSSCCNTLCTDPTPACNCN